MEVARSEVLSALQRWSTEKNLKHVIRIHQVNHGKSKWLYILLVVDEFFTCFDSGEAFSNDHIDIRPRCWSELCCLKFGEHQLPWDQV